MNYMLRTGGHCSKATGVCLIYCTKSPRSRKLAARPLKPAAFVQTSFKGVLVSPVASCESGSLLIGNCKLFQVTDVFAWKFVHDQKLQKQKNVTLVDKIDTLQKQREMKFSCWGIAFWLFLCLNRKQSQQLFFWIFNRGFMEKEKNWLPLSSLWTGRSLRESGRPAAA